MVTKKTTVKKITGEDAKIFRKKLMSSLIELASGKDHEAREIRIKELQRKSELLKDILYNK